MKKNRKPFLILFIGLVIHILSGCDNKDDLIAPTFNITGIWEGNWQGNKTETDHGNILIEITQEGSKLEGKIYFREDLPSLNNSGTDFEGKAYGNEVSFKQLSGAENSFKGVVNGNEISGKVEYGASWNATRIPSSELHVLDSFECPGNFPKYIAVDNQKVWIYDGYDNQIIQVSKNTGKEEKKIFNYEPWKSTLYSDGITSDGTYIYSSHNQEISKILITEPRLPEDLEVVNTPDINLSNLFFDGEYFYVLGYVSAYMYKLSDSGTLLSTTEIKGFGSSIVNDGSNTWILQSSPEILVNYNENGELLEAYRLPHSLENNLYYFDISYDGQNFWALVVHYRDLDPTDPSSTENPNMYYLYKLGKQ